MNAPAPPKKERGELASKTARKLITRAHYAVLALLANIFGAPFWLFEQRRGKLRDRIDNAKDGDR
jgi:hypothetical protein